MSYNFAGFTTKASKTLEHIMQDISTLRTGRASSQMLDIVTVEAYGSRMKVNEVANISTPDPSLLTVTPWDRSLLSAIEKAITISGLNLQPIVDGSMIRIAVPPLTEERRKEMVKLLQQKIEGGKVLLRNVRAEIKKEIERMESEDGVSEDSVKADLEVLEKKVKEFTEKIEKLQLDKTKELMTV